MEREVLHLANEDSAIEMGERDKQTSPRRPLLLDNSPTPLSTPRQKIVCLITTIPNRNTIQEAHTSDAHTKLKPNESKTKARELAPIPFFACASFQG
jgi:hypothetical protein